MTAKEAYVICCKEMQRIIELEPIILTSPCYSYCYALRIVKGRWPEAESRIKQNNYYWEEYCEHFNIKKNAIGR